MTALSIKEEDSSAAPSITSFSLPINQKMNSFLWIPKVKRWLSLKTKLEPILPTFQIRLVSSLSFNFSGVFGRLTEWQRKCPLSIPKIAKWAISGIQSRSKAGLTKIFPLQNSKLWSKLPSGSFWACNWAKWVFSISYTMSINQRILTIWSTFRMGFKKQSPNLEPSICVPILESR